MAHSETRKSIPVGSQDVYLQKRRERMLQRVLEGSLVRKLHRKSRSRTWLSASITLQCSRWHRGSSCLLSALQSLLDTTNQVFRERASLPSAQNIRSNINLLEQTMVMHIRFAFSNGYHLFSALEPRLGSRFRGILIEPLYSR